MDLSNRLDRLESLLVASEKHLSCPICNDMFMEPSTIACGHTFCSHCIHDWFQTKENCPVCREPSPSGHTSDRVMVISEFLKCAKPLLHFRRLYDVENVNGFPISNISDGRQFSEDQNQALMAYIGQSIVSLKSNKNWNAVDKAVCLIRNALASGFTVDEVLRDLQGSRKSKNMGFQLLEKYLESPPDLPEFQEYQYFTTTRTQEYHFEWPTGRSWNQIFFLIVCIWIVFRMLVATEETGLASMQDSFLRSLGLLNLYIGLIRDFRN